MAIAVNPLTGNSSLTDASSYATASVSPAANRLVLIAVYSRVSSGTPNTPSISGNGLTWENIATVVAGTLTNRKISLFRAMSASPSSGAITIDFAGQTQTECNWSVCEFSGVDKSGSNGSGAIVQSDAENQGSPITSFSLTMSAFGSQSNMAYGVVGHATNEATTPGSGFTTIHDVSSTGNNQTILTEYKLNEPTVSASWATGTTGAGIVVEIKAAIDAQGSFTAVAKGFQVLLYDQDFSLKKELGAWAMPPWWEYNRFGGCGQCQISVLMDSDAYEQLFSPRTSVRILVDGEVRYQGRILKFQRRVSTGVQMVTATFYGYASQLARVIVRETYSNMEVSAIVKDILQNYVDPNTDISYVLSEIQATDFTLTSVVFNHSAQDALVFLGQIAGPFEWGVDRNRKFFWRRQDNVVRRIWMLGREINAYDEERSYENVVNSINVFGRDGYLTTPEAASSQDTFGFSEENHFESAITQPSDGNQLGAVILSGRSGVQRAIGLQYLIPDEFLERNVPIGGVSVGIGTVSTRRKYGASTASRRNKYGVSTSSARNKYGVLTSDQLSNVRYSVNGKGLTVQVTVTQEIPTLATQQKRIQYQINELQRR